MDLGGETETVWFGKMGLSIAFKRAGGVEWWSQLVLLPVCIVYTVPQHSTLDGSEGDMQSFVIQTLRPSDKYEGLK